MELVQELVFTISLSLIVSLFIAKLFSVGSNNNNNNNSRVLIRVEETIKKEVKIENFESRVKGIEEGDIGCLEGELGGGLVVDCDESGCGDCACYVFDEMPKRVECENISGGLVESDEGSLVNLGGLLFEEDCVKSVEVGTESVNGVGVCYVFDESPERGECEDIGGGLVESHEDSLVNSSGLRVQENCVKSVGEDTESGSGVSVCYVFDESPERSECENIGGGLVGSDEGSLVNLSGLRVEEDCVKCVEIEQVLTGIDDGEVKVEEEDEMNDDDDWQGVETTELERRFGAAVGFVDAKINSGVVNMTDNEVKVELYGLHKVAIEGSCFEPQPMALKVSARANWNSWKRLENLGREDAMEQYVALLSQHVPGWMGSHSSDKQ